MPLLLTDRATAVSPLPLITTSEARMLGVPLSGSRWLRVRSGTYVDRKAYSALPPWQKYAVRVHAFTRRHPNAVLCLESAAVVHGLPRFGETRAIHVFDPDRPRSRTFGDVVVHTSQDPREVVRVNGVLTTGILDTVGDLSRLLPLAQALSVTDSAISPVQGGSLALDELRAHSERQRNRRGRARFRWVWDHADGLAESPAESISRAVIEWSGFECPELQREFRYGGVLDRTDFYFPTNGAIGETDGWQKYQLEDPAEAARLLTDEKRREDRLRRQGHPFARWDLTGAWKVNPLVEALTAANVARIAPPNEHLLATLRSNPRAKTAQRKPR
ncbi:hypothetical protein DC31_01250 [Microbacterium sp. CH12i]|uniref:hypothetical protein n=1 Tax=Microbacterium sp. CH12i TaxID=1479651 RepID=UPI000460ACCC|nr:hypothetical protein [Microbacterium sp. CH12i]KDA07084.1 hypothetical protein DC31_01250 [Microbacterium sp. CH12i]